MPVSSKSLSSLSSSGSSSSPFSSTWLASLSPNTRKAVYTVVLGGLISALVVPSLLPTRVSFFGIPPVRDVFAHLSTGHAHKAALKRKGLEAWMESERSYAWDRLLDNIGRAGTDPGCVVASPSKKDPDYYYQWTRDSAMVFKVVVEYWKRSKDTHPGQAEKLIFDFIKETKKMQHMETPSGSYRTGGLGEVKFHVDGTPFTGSWGRPQNDGPALRASALMGFANTLLDMDSAKWDSYIRSELYDSSAFSESESVIKADLDYVCGVWNEPCFELWEEVKGSHHFNMLISIRGLLDGAVFAERLGDDSSAKKYRETAAEIQKSLGRFWKEDENYLLATVEPVNDHGKIRWLDTGTVLGFLHSGNLHAHDSAIAASSAAPNDEYLGSDKSLATVAEIGLSMRNEYSINRARYPATGPRASLGYAIGRYYEDVYDGDGKRKTGTGNPWYLCTLAHAEFHYRLMHYFKQRTIAVNAINKKFWLETGFFDAHASADNELMVGQTYAPGSTEHAGLLEALRNKGDGFVKVVRDYARWNGGLWEQFDRENGVEMGAPHLTWSYAAFLSCYEARNGRPTFD